VTEVFAELSVADGAARAVVRPAHATALCAGHFPDDPLVPGAYLLGLMAEVGARLRGGAGPFRVDRCTFLAPVRPARPLVIVARPAPGGRVEAEVQSAGTTAARAVLAFRDAS
jgi:3-hydroxymyristoyl/3-hydroxydecanoyl-(acyl carrier protein) dehydratase